MSPRADSLRIWLACDWFVKYAVGLARGLLDAGHEVTLLTRQHDDEFGGAAGSLREFAEAEVGGEARHLILGGRVKEVRELDSVRRLRGACRAWRPDVIHVQDSLANDPRLAVASGIPPRRYALTVHDPVPHPGDAVPPRSTHFARRVLRSRASLVFVHSDELRRELQEVGGTSAPLVVVPHGVKPPRPQPLPTDDSLLFFGRISHYKGLDVLLEAMPRVWQELPELTLTVAGESTEPLPVHPVLGDPRVRLRVEHIPEEGVAELFGACSCVVLPYRQASQSGVGSLARENGRAVIATAVGGLPELVAPGWGRLVPSEDPPALAAAIVELLEIPGQAATMGAAAAESLGESSWRSVAESTVAAYRRHLL